MIKTSRLRSALLLGVASTAVTCVLAGAASAQTQSPPPPATSGAAAQAATGASGDASRTVGDQTTGIQTVIVTAEKRSVNIQNVPVAVTAFTAKERALEGINTVQDLTNFTPGLEYSSQLDRPSIRGLSRTSNLYTADSSVGVYDNDLFTNSTFLVGRDDMIVDQVEVLEGPQNTLYGRAAVGGIINTQSKRPSLVFGGEVREEVGNYGVNKTEATVTGPLSFINPNLAFRFSGYYDSQDDGWDHNLAGKNAGGVRHDPYEELQLEYKTNQDDIWFMAYNINFFGDRGGPGSGLGELATGPYDTALAGDSSRTGGGAFTYNPNFPYSGGAVPGSVVGQVFPGNPTNLKSRTFAESYNETVDLDDAFSFNFHWTHHFDGFDVKYVGGYTQYHYKNESGSAVWGDSSIQSYQIPLYPLAAVPAAAGNLCGALAAVGACAPLQINMPVVYSFQTQPEWYSHEVDFSSTTNSRLSWISGLYYFNERDNNPITVSTPNQPQVTAAGFNVIPVTGATTYIPTLANALLAGGAPPTKAIFNPSQSGDETFQDYQGVIQSAAIFGQFSYKLTDQFKVTAGLRYSNDQKQEQEEARYIAFANTLPAQLLGQFTPALDITPGYVSTAPGPGVASAVSFPTTGKYAGDAVRQLSGHSDAITGTFDIDYTPDRDTLAYARYNRGYKALALNAGEVFGEPLAKPEFVNDYEVGLKQNIGRTLQFDISAFYYDYSNDQVPLGVPTATPIGATTTDAFINIPKAVSDGVEVETVWSPIHNLSVQLTYGFDHTEILTGCAPYTQPLGTFSTSCFVNPEDPLALAAGAKPAGPTTTGFTTQSVKGNALPEAPENKVALNLTYTLNFEPGNLILSGSYVWRDHEQASIFRSTQFDYAPSWSQVDLRATWSGNHDKYEIVAYVKNLFNTLGYEAAYPGLGNAMPQGGGPATVNPVYDLTPPRLFGGEIHYKF